MAWFEEHRDKFPDVSELAIPEDIEGKLEHLEKAFPNSNITHKFNEVHRKMKDRQDASDKFSGKHIQALYPEIQGRDFGKFMQAWSNQWTSADERVQFVLNHSIEELQENVHKIKEALSNE